MTEHVVALDLGVVWQPNAPEAMLLADDSGQTVLAINPHPDDQDQRCVVLVWTGTHSASLADPNDETISGHRLYDKGLSEVLWAGLVPRQRTHRSLERQGSVHPSHEPSRFDGLTHHVLQLKECVTDVVARAITVRRTGGTTLDAAPEAMRR